MSALESSFGCLAFYSHFMLTHTHTHFVIIESVSLNYLTLHTRAKRPKTMVDFTCVVRLFDLCCVLTRRKSQRIEVDFLTTLERRRGIADKRYTLTYYNNTYVYVCVCCSGLLFLDFGSRKRSRLHFRHIIPTACYGLSVVLVLRCVCLCLCKYVVVCNPS